MLDGSRSSCNWGTDPSAIEPGIFGPKEHLPSLFRNDYVANSNDSYWLSNPEQPLTGFPLIIGDEDTAALAAHAARARPDPAAACGHRRPAGQPLHARPAPGHGLRQPPARRRAVARPAGRAVPLQPRPRRLARPGERGRRVSRAGRLGPALRPRLARSDPVPDLRGGRAGDPGRALQRALLRPGPR
ncbi:MAG: hypothetical protein WKF40_08040 [Thermoleophilaceae bacterium]